MMGVNNIPQFIMSELFQYDICFHPACPNQIQPVARAEAIVILHKMFKEGLLPEIWLAQTNKKTLSLREHALEAQPCHVILPTGHWPLPNFQLFLYLTKVYSIDNWWNVSVRRNFF